MLLKCPVCAVECTVDESSSGTASCPSCGCQLRSSEEFPCDVETTSNAERTATLDQAFVAPTVADELQPGQRVGKYEVQSAIARGGFGRVYLATDLELDRSVALKLPRTERNLERRDLDAVLSEAKTAAGLRHPGIVTIYDVGYFADGRPFIAMEYIAGKSLRQVLAKGQLSFQRAAEWIAAMADAIHYAHQQGIVHRDLKPANVLIDERGEPKIVDFGLALHESRQPGKRGDVSGTPAYMAPEQIRGDAHRMDGRTDIWSLGVIFYEMLVARRPFNGDGHQLFDEILHRDPKPLRQINDHVPKPLEDICLHCLAKPLAARYSTARDVAELLRDWLRTSGSSSSSTSFEAAPSSLVYRPSSALALEATASVSSQPTSSGRSPRIQVIVATLLLGLTIVLVGIGVNAWQGPPPPDANLDNPLRASASGVTPQSHRWYPLLDRAPEILIFSGLATDSIPPKYDNERQELLLSSSQPTAVTLLDVDSTDFQFDVRISKSAWLGRVGVFWGGHTGIESSGEASVVCQSINLFSFVDGGAVEHRLDREVFEFWTPPGLPSPAMNRSGFLSADVAAPNNAEMRLELTVKGNLLQSVRWNGVEIESLVDGPDRLPPQPLASRGKLGLYNEAGAAAFRDARIQLLRIPVPAKESELPQ